TTSHVRQYPSMVLPDSSNLSSARRVYASCSCFWPHAGHAEKKGTGFVMGVDPFGDAAAEVLTATREAAGKERVRGKRGRGDPRRGSLLPRARGRTAARTRKAI